jgi:hypothetical protein
VRFRKNINAGRFQLSRADTLTGTYSNVGAVQDGYSPIAQWVTVTLANVTFSTAGQKFLKFVVNGKRAFASGYQLFPDYVDLVRQ